MNSLIRGSFELKKSSFDPERIELDFAKKITKKETLAVRQKTEMVFQDYNLFPHLTVLKKKF